MTEAGGLHFGRSDVDWAALTREGLQFLIEQAQMGRTTTYTELNAVLARRTGRRPFDFNQESERAAMGDLLYRIVEDERPRSGHMISALVIYLNESDAGAGFYRLAQQYGVLPAKPNARERDQFWSGEVAAIHDHYRRRPRRR